MAAPKLRYKNFEDLKNSSELDKSSTISLKKLDAKGCYKQFVEIERNARIKHKDDDWENAFTLFQRAMSVYRIINDKMKNDVAFRRSKDARDLHDLSSKMLIDMELLAEDLKLRYKQLGMEENIVEKQTTPSPSQVELSAVDDEHIKPRQLLQCIEAGQHVMIIDYRRDQDKHIKLPTSMKAEVIHLSPDNLLLGSLMQSISMTLDISDRPRFEKISRYDLVVLLSDLDDIAKPSGSKTRILYAALTTHNRIQLKRPPKVLDGGFEEWNFTYPCHTATKCEQQSGLGDTFDAHFTYWMDQSKTGNSLERIVYPNLAEPDTLNTHQSIVDKPNAIPAKQRVPHPSNLKFSSAYADLLPEETRNKVGSDNNLNKSTITRDPTQDKKLPGKLPNIDRSKKPTELSIYSQKKEQPSGNQDDFMQDKENRAAIDPNNKRFAAQTLGGARMAMDNAPPKFPSPPPQPQLRSHEPLVDRSTKKGILQQQLPAVKFMNSYEMAFTRIREDSYNRQKTTIPGHTGLINIGNTCFMNATLQALLHTPRFFELFNDQAVAPLINTKNSLGTMGIISGCFCALLDLAWSGEYQALNPIFFLKMFASRVNAALADGKQHDAQEFQIYLLDALHEDTNRVERRQPFEQSYDTSNLPESARDFTRKSRHFSSSPVNDIFNMITVSVLQCRICTATSVCFEGINQISVELPQFAGSAGPNRLKDCLRTHFSSTMLDAPWDCPQCRRKQAASRKTNIWTIPKILIIHLKRFSYNSGHFVKNEIDVDFEIENLDLAPYLHQKAPSGKAKYNLYAVTNHYGTLNSGHYTSCAKNLKTPDEWLRFDDDQCSRINYSSLASRHAFLLYYTLDES